MCSYGKIWVRNGAKSVKQNSFNSFLYKKLHFLAMTAATWFMPMVLQYWTALLLYFQGEVPKFVTSVCFTPDGDVLSGDSNGNITLWSQDQSGAFSVNRRATTNLRQAHKKYALYSSS